MNEKKSYEELSAERKHLTAQNEVPEWMTTQGYIMFRNKYAYKGETVRSRFQTIAKTLAKYLPFEHQETAEQKFFDIMWKGHLAPSTPVYCNTGTNRGHSVSCSGSYIEDSIDGFYSALREMALLSKNGYGTSAYLGDIRPRGTPISVGGEADGVVPVFDMFTRTAQLVSQGNNRRGSWAGYIDMDHGDFDEMNDYVLKNPGEANIGYNFTDEFIERLSSGDEEAIRRYSEMMYTRSRFGKGYIWKSDVANRLAPECIRQTGEKVYASNLCFSGDTLVAVADGRDVVTIKQLAEESNGTVKFPVYCSKQLTKLVGFDTWSKPIVRDAVAFKTGTKQVVEVTLENGDKFKCTPDHQLATFRGTWIKAKDSLGYELQAFNLPHGLKVTNIEYLEGEVDVYDLTVEEVHNFYIAPGQYACNGILVHNCTEIALPASEELTFSCVLSSLNLAKWDEFDEDTIFWSLVFLDCICSHSLIQMQTTPGLEKIARFTEKYRALGLGALGFHTYLQSKMIPIDSLQAGFENMAIFRKIHDETLRASKWLAEILGECEVTKGYGIRNSTRTAIAPNMSSAVLCGGVSQGIEPFVSNTFTQNTAAGNMVRINPEFIKVLKKYDKYNDDIVRDINDNYQGSVQHLDFLTDEEKAVFKTAFEINQSALVRLAAQRQKFICQGQSLNLFFVEDEEYISEVTREALENPNIKGLYYQRSTRLTRGSNPRGECIACEG